MGLAVRRGLTKVGAFGDLVKRGLSVGLNFRIIMGGNTKMLVDNEFRESVSKQWIDVKDPATNEAVTKVPVCTPNEVNIAIGSAAKAFEMWKRKSLIARQELMFKFVELIKREKRRLARCITLEQGKTFSDALGDVYRGLQVAETACGITTQLMGEVLPVAEDMETRTYREPLGVVTAICPFNFPAMIPLWSIPIAVVTGNTIVVKPSERVPNTSMILGELAVEAGFPGGVLNIIHGTRSTIDQLIDDERIKAVSFVGGNKAGEYIFTEASKRGKRVQANLGAKNHAILMEDCNKEMAIKAIVGAAFGAAGQRCMAISVCVMVGETKFWMKDLVKAAKALKVNGGFEDNVDLGPIISEESLKRIEGIIQRANNEGAHIELDGRNIIVEKYPHGNWIGPTILSNVNESMECYREEIFGPVLICIEVDNLDSAIQIVNRNVYGNGCAIFTQNGSIAEKFQREVNIGQVGLNVTIPVALPMFSFTSAKGSVSGQGINSFYGRPALNFYTKTKTVTSLWISGFSAPASRSPLSPVPSSSNQLPDSPDPNMVNMPTTR